MLDSERPTRPHPGNLEVRTLDMSSAGGPYVVEVSGEIDIFTIQGLEDPVIGAIQAGRRPVLLDLSGCEFIDSMGIRLVLHANQLLSDNGGRAPSFAVVASGHVLRLFKLTAIDRAIPVVGTREEADSLLDSASANA